MVDVNPEQASSNFFWTLMANAGEFHIQTTVRGHLSNEQIEAHISSAKRTMAAIVHAGGSPKAVGTGGAVSSVSSVSRGSGEKSFVADELFVEIKGRKTYAKVKGGNFKQHGVIVWWEPLAEAGIIQGEDEWNHLDPRHPPNISGWTAVYTEKQHNGSMIPDKVVQLLPPK